MESYRNKLPTLRLNRFYSNKQTKSRNNNLQLNIYNSQNYPRIKQSLFNLRRNNSYNNAYFNNNKNKNINCFGTDILEKNNNEQNLIKKFLYQNVKRLKPIKNLTKSKSTLNIYKEKYNYFFQDEIDYNNINHKNKDNITFELFKKFNKNLGNKIHLNKIKNLNKHLIKENENDTNGNLIYDDYDEEKKESITFIINNNNSKEFYKKRLTKDNNNNKIINQDNKMIDNFKYHGKRYNSPGIKNMNRIKYIQGKLEYKNNIYMNINNGNQKERDMCTYLFIEKLKDVKSKIKENEKNLLKMEGLVESCLNDARNKFNMEIKNIFGSKFN